MALIWPIQLLVIFIFFCLLYSVHDILEGSLPHGDDTAFAKTIHELQQSDAKLHSLHMTAEEDNSLHEFIDPIVHFSHQGTIVFFY